MRDIISDDLKNVCSDDALWLVPAVVEYIKETGEESFLEETFGYADGGSGTVYEHLTRILDFTARQVGQNGIAKGLRADWNDCLNLGGGESAMVSFLYVWAIEAFLELAHRCGRQEDVERYNAMADEVRAACERVLWDGKWYIRGITASGPEDRHQRRCRGKGAYGVEHLGGDLRRGAGRTGCFRDEQRGRVSVYAVRSAAQCAVVYSAG